MHFHFALALAFQSINQSAILDKEIGILHLHFEFKFHAKNSEFFRLKYLNFPPKKLDVIVVGGVGGGHGDNSGTSFNCISALNQLYDGSMYTNFPLICSDRSKGRKSVVEIIWPWFQVGNNHQNYSLGLMTGLDVLLIFPTTIIHLFCIR